jgi:hypothetical protein
MVYRQKQAENRFRIISKTDSHYYWSSSQYDNGGAWGQSFSYGYQVKYGTNGSTASVRAIRVFYLFGCAKIADTKFV